MVVLAICAGPQRRHVPDRACRKTMTGDAAGGIRRGDTRPGRSAVAGKRQLAEHESAVDGIEFSGLDCGVTTLGGVPVEGDDETRIAAEEDHTRRVETGAL